jgi:hypothetical protein
MKGAVKNSADNGISVNMSKVMHLACDSKSAVWSRTLPLLIFAYEGICLSKANFVAFHWQQRAKG